MEQFFAKFPTIIYNGLPVVDMSKTVVIDNNVLNNPFLFQEENLIEGIRSDQLARKFYGDPYFEWLIFMSNQMIDPYNQWYMDTSQFYDYIEQKYSDITLAQQKIKYYTNNWYNSANISVSGFDSLSRNLTKYYQPIYDAANNVMYYTRTPVDWEITTNRVMSFTFAESIANVGNFYTNSEIVTITYDANTAGSGQVTFCSNTILSLQHLSGSYLPNTQYIFDPIGFSLVGAESNNVVTIAFEDQIEAITTADALAADEQVFFDPVTFYDFEDQKNENNKVINILSNTYSSQVAQSFNNLLK